jgi:hypothetical protein
MNDVSVVDVAKDLGKELSDQNATIEEAVDKLSYMIVDAVGNEEALEVFRNLNEILRNQNEGGLLWGTKTPQVPSKLFSDVAKNTRSTTSITNVALQAIQCFNGTGKEKHPMPYRAPRQGESKLRGQKRNVYCGDDIDKQLVAYAGIQEDGTIDRSKKVIPGRYAIVTNGLGSSMVGESKKVVECPSSKERSHREWKGKPISISLVSLALLYGKAMKKHFMKDALQTVHIFKNEFGYSFEEFMGLRSWSMSVAAKGSTGILVQYERSSELIEEYLKNIKSTNENYLQLSSLVDRLYFTLTDPEQHNLYCAESKDWGLQHHGAATFNTGVKKKYPKIHW